PHDQRAAMLGVGGAYQPVPSMAQRIRDMAARAGTAAKTSRRQFNLALIVGWAGLAFVGATFGAMFQDFFGPKALKEPKKQWRVGRLENYALTRLHEGYKHTARRTSGFST